MSVPNTIVTPDFSAFLNETSCTEARKRSRVPSGVSGGAQSVYFRLGDYKQAASYIKKAIDKGEVSPVVHEHLGDVYYKMKDTERALEEWRIALKMDESNTSLREKIARGSL